MSKPELIAWLAELPEDLEAERKKLADMFDMSIDEVRVESLKEFVKRNNEERGKLDEVVG